MYHTGIYIRTRSKTASTQNYHVACVYAFKKYNLQTFVSYMQFISVTNLKKKTLLVILVKQAELNSPKLTGSGTKDN